MIHLLSANWYSIGLTLVLGTLAYFFVYWLRLRQVNSQRGRNEQLTLKELIDADWEIVLTSVTGQYQEPKTKEEEKPEKPQLPRGGSSGNLKAVASSEKKKLQKKASVSNISLSLSWHC